MMCGKPNSPQPTRCRRRRRLAVFARFRTPLGSNFSSPVSPTGRPFRAAPRRYAQHRRRRPAAAGGGTGSSDRPASTRPVVVVASSVRWIFRVHTRPRGSTLWITNARCPSVSAARPCVFCVFVFVPGFCVVPVGPLVAFNVRQKKRPRRCKGTRIVITVVEQSRRNKIFKKKT